MRGNANLTEYSNVEIRPVPVAYHEYRFTVLPTAKPISQVFLVFLCLPLLIPSLRGKVCWKADRLMPKERSPLSSG